MSSLDARVLEMCNQYFVQQQQQQKTINPLETTVNYFTNIKPNDLRFCLFQSETVSTGMCGMVAEYKCPVHSPKQSVDSSLKAPLA